MSHCYEVCVFTPLSGWSVPCGAPTNASSSTPCAPPACSGTPVSPEADTPPQEGAGGATPGTEAATAAEHLPEITEATEAARTINTITGTAAITKIRSRIETERGATGTKTTESGDTREMASTETKTGCVSKDLCPEEGEGHSSFREVDTPETVHWAAEHTSTELRAGWRTCPVHLRGHSKEDLFADSSLLKLALFFVSWRFI